MQITIDLPETLGEKLRLFPNLNDFITKLLSQTLADVRVLQDVLQNTSYHADVNALRRDAIEDLLLLSHNACSRRGDRVWTREELHER
jgi:hypothetical protein